MTTASTRRRPTSRLPELFRQPRRERLRKQPLARSRLWLERLEDRVTPSILGTFELDANATTGVLGTSGSTTTSHDWDQVYADNQTTPPGTSSGALASSFVTDAVNSNADDIFQGGGSKDTLGIQSGRWLFTDAKPQGKDDITHAYAAAYTDSSNGHTILYAGLDRYDNSGDATAGFWFFANNIGENASVTTNGGHPFTGTHSTGVLHPDGTFTGDILLVSDFTIGGSLSTIKVYGWVGTDSSGSLQLLGGNSSNTFAIVNDGPTSVPWSYTNKSGAHSPDHGEFLEEGVDLTALGIQGCFSSFLAETRSSQSPTATLSDFVLGSFPLCSLGTPQQAGLSKVGDSFTYNLSVQNTGAMPLYIQNVTDTLLGNIVVNGVLQQPGAAGVNQFVTSISSTFDFTKALAPGASLNVAVTRTVQASDPDPTISFTTFVGNDEPDFSDTPISTTTPSPGNVVNLFQPSASLTVTASPTTATALGQVITYTYTVTNTSSSDSPNLVLSTSNPNDSFTDTLLGDLEADAIAAGAGSMAPGATVTFTETRAIQAGDPTPLTDTAKVAFTLAQNLGNFTNVIKAQASASVTLVPHLTISKAVTGGVDVIHPGDTASFTITVTNDGAGPATNVVVTDALPDADLLTWKVTSSTFDTASIDTGGNLTATDASLPAGSTVTVVVSAVVPLDFFGTSGGGAGTGNGDPVPLNLFELDGNAVTGVLVTPNTPPGSTTPSHDWDQVYNDNAANPKTNTADAIASSFVTDKINSNSDDIFTGGGSKDPNAISQWQFKGGKPQGKDDIENAFAALYKDPVTGDQILYAGLTRFDNSGDATAGFWFFVNPISENADGTFSGAHSDGDILLVSDFTVGGSKSTIAVYEWHSVPVNGDNLVLVHNGNLEDGTTFAIVNGSNVTLPWTFLNKSKVPGNVALPGEFLEEGINLTGLGLNGCFSSFLAETRSSQSETATLSDFVLGSFSTCDVKLPNTATVKADGIAPITSNEVVIDINDGDALEATSLGNAAGTDALTAAQVQSAVAQAIAGWRAAGVDPERLHVLDNLTVHVGNLPGAELGYEVPGQIWIDRTAAGWGWSVNGGPGMDLGTVVTHELGHALGFEHSAAGVMEPTLAPGVRLTPEALTGTGSVVVSTAPTTDGPAVAAWAAVPGAVADGPAGAAGAAAEAPLVRAGEAGGVQARFTQATPPRTEALDVALVAEMGGVTTFATATAQPEFTAPPAGAILDGAGAERGFTGGPLNLGPRSYLLPSGTATDTEDAPAVPDQDFSGAPVTGRWPAIVLPGGGVGDEVLPPGAARAAVPSGWVPPTTDLADALFGGGAEALGAARSRQRVCDACFASALWGADSPESPGEALAPAAVAALGLLAGHRAVLRAEAEERTRRRFLL
jgi:uncharacterized repeat protein (TIGR01451 family)